MVFKLSSDIHKDLLDHKSPIPLHYQLTEILRKEILNGSGLATDMKLPTESALIKRFKVSRVTVRTALKTLVDEGLLSRERGRGTFIKTNKAENWTGQLMGFSEVIQSAGFTPGGKILYKGFNFSPPKEVCKDLNTDSVWEMKRIRFADDQPIGIEQSYYVEVIGKELEKASDLENIVMYKYIEDNLNIPLFEANQLITAINANADEAEMLDLSEGDALLRIKRITKTVNSKPLIILNAVYRPDYFQYVIDLKR